MLKYIAYKTWEREKVLAIDIMFSPSTPVLIVRKLKNLSWALSDTFDHRSVLDAQGMCLLWCCCRMASQCVSLNVTLGIASARKALEFK